MEEKKPLVFDCYMSIWVDDYYLYPEKVTISLSEKDIEYYHQIVLILEVLNINSCTWHCSLDYQFLTDDSQSFYYDEEDSYSTTIQGVEYKVCNPERGNLYIDYFDIKLSKEGNISLEFDAGNNVRVYTHPLYLYDIK